MSTSRNPTAEEYNRLYKVFGDIQDLFGIKSTDTYEDLYVQLKYKFEGGFIKPPPRPIKDCKIRNGYRVIGANTTDYKETVWYFSTLEQANAFASQLTKDTGKEVDVCKYLGSWRRPEPSMEFIKSED